MRSSSSCSTSGPPAKRSKPNPKFPIQRSPFTDIGSYMTMKNRKLRSQFHAQAISSSGERKGIFHGVSIFVDGHTVPSSQELREVMMMLGGNVENYFSKSRVTHIICSNLSDSKMKNMRSFSRGLPVLKPEWIVDSLAENKLLNWLPYQLIEQSSELCKQQKLSSFFGCKTISSVNDDGFYDEMDSEGLKKSRDQLLLEGKEFENHELGLKEEAKFATLLDEGTKAESSNLAFVQPSIRTCKTISSVNDDGFYDEMDSEGSKKSRDLLLLEEGKEFESHELGLKEEAKFATLVDEGTNTESSNLAFVQPSIRTCNNVDEISSEEFRRPPDVHHSTLTDPNFVENYFKHSRLHFIGTWRNRYRKQFCNDNKNIRSTNINGSSSFSKKASIIHVDMDCFFVSVILRKYPELLHKPVAVSHSDNSRGTAEISSANYPARVYGIKAGMFMRDAKTCCPNLVVFPYDFRAYEEVADQFYCILHKHCNKVQALSCDEAFLDITDCDNFDPENFASMIREEIAETTQCTASVGIAGNMLIARLATKFAKPNGQCFIPPEKVESFFADLPISALTGIGRAAHDKLETRKIQTCGQLKLLSKDILHKDFGVKVGNMLWNYCRGIDDRKVDALKETRSVGAEVNWGVRFRNTMDCEHFLKSLSKEISSRLLECGVVARGVTLKVKKRRKGANEPAKFMGCGDCKNLSRSMTLPVATDDADLILKIAKQIFASYHIDVKEVRGIGLQMSRLEVVDANMKGHKQNAIDSWFTTPTTVREDISQLDSWRDGTESLRASEERLLISRSHGHPHDDSISALPHVTQLDMSVVKDLPPDIVAEMNAAYNGKLYDLLKKKNGNLVISPMEGELPTASCSKSNNLKINSAPEDPNFDKSLPMQGVQNRFEKQVNVIESKSSMLKMLWTGNPPKWVEKFEVSNCLMLNLVAQLHLKFAAEGLFSYTLQWLISLYPIILGSSKVESVESRLDFCELLLQYIDVKIDSDIEELYLCCRLLKRLASISDIFSAAYSIVLPQLQASVSENYGGSLQL